MDKSSPCEERGLTNRDFRFEVGPGGLSDKRGRMLWKETMDFMWPTGGRKYHGKLYEASIATGYSKKSVDRWRYGGCFGVPRKAAERIVALLKWRILASQQLLEAWEKYLNTMDVKKAVGEEMDSWRQKKRDKAAAPSPVDNDIFD